MGDRLTPEQRSDLMRRVRGKDTRPEMIVRRLVHGMGYRYRLHRWDLPGPPDLAFGPRRKVIFVHGCFWHRHDDPSCKLARLPESNLEYWLQKLETNKARDTLNQEKLVAVGWNSLVVWQCKLRNTSYIESEIRAFLDHEID
jgi:DNA mismatch endonuclease (patch repair protein)